MRLSLQADNSKVVFPINPESIDLDESVRSIPIETLEDAIEFPNGSVPSRYSWTGILPGRARRNAPYVHSGEWKDPETIDARIREWLDNSKILTFQATETKLRDRVYVASYTSSRRGGHDDIYYSITLVEHRNLHVKRKKKKANDGKGGGRDDAGGDEAKGGKSEQGRSSGERRTYVTKRDDTLTKIARRFLGSVTRWREIWDIDSNKRKIERRGGDPENLPTGIELVIPRR